MTETDDALRRLHRAGWSVGSTALAGPAGLVWIVTGSHGENLISADGAAEAEAWRAAVEQARSLVACRGGGCDVRDNQHQRC